MSARSRLTAFDIALYGGVTFAWGFTWLAQHYQVGMVAPEVSVLWRFVIAAPCMLAIAAIRGEQFRFPLRDHLWLALLGLTLFCTNFVLFYYAAQWVTSGLLSVVFALASIINIVLGALLLGTPIDRRTVIGAFLGVGGLAAMFYPQLASTDLNSQMLDRNSAERRRDLFVLLRQHDLGAAAAPPPADFRNHRHWNDLRRLLPRLVRGLARPRLHHRADGALCDQPALPRADRLGAGFHLLPDIARPDRRGSRRLCDRDVSGCRACRLDRVRRLSLDHARGLGVVAVLAGIVLALRAPKKT